MRKIFLISLIILLSACAAYNNNHKTARNWQGSPFKALQQEWGAPDQTKTAKNGNTLYRYTNKREQDFNAPTMTNYSTLIAPGHAAIGIPAPMQNSTGAVMQLECTQWVEVNKQKTIVRITAAGNDCNRY